MNNYNYTISTTDTITETPVFDENTNCTNNVQAKVQHVNIEHIDESSLDVHQYKKTYKEPNPIFSTENLNVVEHPNHYGAGNGGLQCIEAMLQTFGKDATMAFCKLNAFKYIWRSDHKEKEVQDMEKAKRYLEYWHVLNKINANGDDGSFHEYLNS